MGDIGSYKYLVAWQKAYEITLEVYRLLKGLPSSERYGFISQMQRCAVSVPSNIAEVYSRHSLKDYLRFVHIAYSSLSELETQFLLVRDLEYIKSKDLERMFELIKRV
jgi:four helix bundle protein